MGGRVVCCFVLHWTKTLFLSMYNHTLRAFFFPLKNSSLPPLPLCPCPPPFPSEHWRSDSSRLAPAF